MVPRTNIQLLSTDGGAPGSAGFKLTGSARDGSGLCRIWLRRKEPWNRYLDPRFRSDDWDVRCYRRTDSAFSLVEEFRVDTLDALAEEFAFEGAGQLAALKPNGDVVHDTVLRWAKSAVGASPDAPGEVVAPAEVAAPTETKTVLPLRSAPAQAVVDESAAATEPEAAVATEPEAVAEPEATAEPEAAAEPETAAEPEAATEPESAVAPAAPPTVDVPVPAHPVEPTPIEVPAIEPTDIAPPSALEMSDAWDEIADLAEQATADAPDSDSE